MLYFIYIIHDVIKSGDHVTSTISRVWLQPHQDADKNRTRSFTLTPTPTPSITNPTKTPPTPPHPCPHILQHWYRLTLGKI